jgi:hypothetical protein
MRMGDDGHPPRRPVRILVRIAAPGCAAGPSRIHSAPGSSALTTRNCLFICINSIKKPSAFQKQIYPTECTFNKHRKIGFSVVLQIYLCDFRKRLLVFCKDDSDSPRPLTAVQT